MYTTTESFTEFVQRHDLTQTQVAEIIGKNQATVSRYLKGANIPHDVSTKLATWEARHAALVLGPDRMMTPSTLREFMTCYELEVEDVCRILGTHQTAMQNALDSGGHLPFHTKERLWRWELERAGQDANAACTVPNPWNERLSIENHSQQGDSRLEALLERTGWSRCKLANLYGVKATLLQFPHMPHLLEQSLQELALADLEEHTWHVQAQQQERALQLQTNPSPLYHAANLATQRAKALGLAPLSSQSIALTQEMLALALHLTHPLLYTEAEEDESFELAQEVYQWGWLGRGAIEDGLAAWAAASELPYLLVAPLWRTLKEQVKRTTRVIHPELPSLS